MKLVLRVLLLAGAFCWLVYGFGAIDGSIPPRPVLVSACSYIALRMILDLGDVK